MGRDAMAVVANNLQVCGIDRPRIADTSIMPRVTTNNLLAPCVVTGECLGDILKRQHGL